MLRKQPTQWSRQVAAAMEAEVERADCRDMVRDITHAVLPTRASMKGGLGAVSLGPAAIHEEDPATGARAQWRPDRPKMSGPLCSN